ncbi:MAG TPA: PhoPQ-activated protein PqaA family protein [Hanamia sp.]|nr:PhoPQ-activated protein PqaA family protein [Hanamia sp.]
MKKLLSSFSLVFFTQIFFVFTIAAQDTITPATALQHYLHKADPAYQWEIKDSFEMDGVKGYDLLLTSQKWRQYTWRHQLTILSPKENNYDGALLFITGGSDKNEQPNWNKRDDKLTKMFVSLAEKNKAIIAIIRQVPNQPLYDSLKEDALISYTLHQFKEDNDYTWPLLFPMVKSAVKAMDAVQEFSNKNLQHPINRFVISGASKRGWTTWLTGASDPRVQAIGPMVIDILNMPVNLKHQLDAYGKYSVEIEDYVKLGIVQGMGTENGHALVTMIDPYSYRDKLTMPKMLFMGTNDPYWVIDNVKNYLKDIPGDNLLHYVPNAGHGLGDGKSAFSALSAFFGIAMKHGTYPLCKWKTSENKKGVKLTVAASKDILLGATLWYANSDDKDFRNEQWQSRDLHTSHKAKIKTSEPFPAKGYRAFYLDLKYKDANGGDYTVSTRAFMVDGNKIL